MVGRVLPFLAYGWISQVAINNRGNKAYVLIHKQSHLYIPPFSPPSSPNNISMQRCSKYCNWQSNVPGHVVWPPIIQNQLWIKRDQMSLWGSNHDMEGKDEWRWGVEQLTLRKRALFCLLALFTGIPALVFNVASWISIINKYLTEESLFKNKLKARIKSVCILSLLLCFFKKKIII